MSTDILKVELSSDSLTQIQEIVNNLKTSLNNMLEPLRETRNIPSHS